MAGILGTFQLLVYPQHACQPFMTSGGPGSSGGPHEIREANSLSLKSRSSCYTGDLALLHIYPTAGRGPTSLWQSWRLQRDLNPRSPA